MILDGKLTAQGLKVKLIEDLKTTKVGYLAIIQINPDEASKIYLRSRLKLGEELGVEVKVFEVELEDYKSKTIELIKTLNDDQNCSGIMVDRPLPNKTDEDEILNSIKYYKDVDGVSETNIGRLTLGLDCLVAPTSQAAVDILTLNGIDVQSKKVTVIGRSKNVGRPAFELLVNKNATATICHSKTVEMEKITNAADIVIVCMGKQEYIDEKFVNSNTIIVDVGIHRVDGKVVGDVKQSVYSIVDSYSPVPGGVGALTNVELFANLVKGARMHDR